MTIAHGLDALVLIPNCDKIVPGMLIAAARLNIPAIIRAESFVNVTARLLTVPIRWTLS